MIQNGKRSAIEPIWKPIVQPFKQLQYAGGVPERSSPWSCARASSAPNSSERNAQANRLVSLSLAPLQKTISEVDLGEWIKTVPTGKQYYFAMNDVDAQLEDIPNLLSILREKLDADKDPWKEDAAAVNEASEKVQAWIEKSIIKSFATYQDAVAHAPSVLATLMVQKQELLTRFLRDQTIEEGRAEVPCKGQGRSKTGSKIWFRMGHPCRC